MICVTAAFSGTAPGDGSLEKSRPKGEAITAAIRKITQRAAARVAPPTRAERTPIRDFTAFAVAAAAFRERAAVALAVFFVPWLMVRWASFFAFWRIRSARRFAVVFFPAGVGAFGGTTVLPAACSMLRRVLGVIVQPWAFSFRIVEDRGRCRPGQSSSESGAARPAGLSAPW